MKKFISIAIVLLLCASMVFAQGGQETKAPKEKAPAAAPVGEPVDVMSVKANKPYDIVYINAFLTAPYMGYMNRAMYKTADDLGIKLTILDGKSDSQTMLDQANDCVIKGVDCVLLCCADQAGSVSIVQTIHDAGIPLVYVNTPGDPSVGDLVDSAVYPNLYNEGKVIGETCREQNPNGGVCILLEGTAGTETQIMRTKGFTDAIEGSGIKIVDRNICDWDKQISMSATEDMISAHPDLSIIYAHDDTMALGAIEAVKAAGLTDKIKVYGIGFMGEESKAALLEGTLAATCTQSPSWEGEFGVKLGVAILNGEPVEKLYMVQNLPVNAENCKTTKTGFEEE